MAQRVRDVAAAQVPDAEERYRDQIVACLREIAKTDPVIWRRDRAVLRAEVADGVAALLARVAEHVQERNDRVKSLTALAKDASLDRGPCGIAGVHRLDTTAGINVDGSEIKAENPAKLAATMVGAALADHR